MTTEWTHQTTDRYLIVGRTTDGKRFRLERSNPFQALGINLYDGRVYLLRENRRILVRRVTP